MKYVYLILFYFLSFTSIAQTDDLYQFWNEYDFSKDISQNWVLQFDAGFVTSSTAEYENIFHNITQVYVRGWAHYYLNQKWKFSVFASNYSNKNVPELNQKKAREFRTGLQATYSLFQLPSIKVNLRARFEDRHMETDENYQEAVERFRFQIKAVCPLSTFGIETKKIYLFGSDELFFKTKSKVSGPDFFDRNRASLGCGFELSTVKIEMAYVNEIMPRSGSDKLVNAFQIKGIFNNFFSDIAKSFKRKKSAVDEGDGDLK
ncbi:DUF2490 domain-containing protein [Flavobacterium sp. IB48]|uniref:DUF2490 domain-containing protein n=1 Tax=Flavobacterium sp. IB48 TaxID=2779375 RepID=UPI0018E73DAC|nr:DUF2490 domain-containing protein [Flavobacterium sp. IB48]MBJ2127304.1 DUF2490 domain-containing protein [Flavobacterium sp. IB48]